MMYFRPLEGTCAINILPKKIKSIHILPQISKGFHVLYFPVYMEAINLISISVFSVFKFIPNLAVFIFQMVPLPLLP